MKQVIILDEKEVEFADLIYKMLIGNPNVREVIRKKGFIDLRMPVEHWCKILNYLLPKEQEG